MNSHRTGNYIVSAAFVVAVLFFQPSLFAQSLVTLKTPGTNFAVVGKKGTAVDVAGGRRFRATAFAELRIRGALRVPKSASGVSKTHLMQQLVIHFRTSASGPSLRSVELLTGGSNRRFFISTDIKGDYTTRSTSTPAGSANMWKWTSPIKVDSQSVIVLGVQFPGGFDSEVDPGEFVLTSVDAQFQGEGTLNIQRQRATQQAPNPAGGLSHGAQTGWTSLAWIPTGRWSITLMTAAGSLPGQDWEPHGGFTSPPARPLFDRLL